MEQDGKHMRVENGDKSREGRERKDGGNEEKG